MRTKTKGQPAWEPKNIIMLSEMVQDRIWYEVRFKLISIKLQNQNSLTGKFALNWTTFIQDLLYIGKYFRIQK